MIVFLRVLLSETGGTHHYGDLATEENHESEEVTHTITRAEARLLNRRVRRMSYKAGDTSIKFTSLSRLRLAAVEQYKRQWPAATHLIESRHSVLVEPKIVLDGLGKDELNALCDQCEKLGWWDGEYTDAVEKICEEWHALLERRRT